MLIVNVDRGIYEDVFEAVRVTGSSRELRAAKGEHDLVVAEMLDGSKQYIESSSESLFTHVYVMNQEGKTVAKMTIPPLPPGSIPQPCQIDPGV